MTEQLYPVRLVSQSKAELEGVFVINEDEPIADEACRLILRYSGGEITAADLTYFHALCRIREELEVRGWRPFCYGSSRNVYPSGMCFDMGRGLQGYRRKLGQRGDLEDIVQIFDSGPDVEPVTVEEQEKFRHDWRQSLS